MFLILSNKIIFFVLFIIALYIIIYIVSKIECNLCKINTFYVKNDKNHAKTSIIFISDFHNKKFKNDYNDLIDDIISLNPEYIVLGGDFVDFSTFQSRQNNVKYKRTLLFINKLCEKFYKKDHSKDYNLKGIFFGFGNHELRLKTRTDNSYLSDVYKQLINTLYDNNIKILDDTTYVLNDGITLSGMSLYEGYYSNLFEKNILKSHIEQNIIDNSFNTIDRDRFNIMVFHKPDYCEDFIDYGFDLVLSGHNHGGLINFPFIGPIFSPDLKLFPKYNSGQYTYKNKNVIISSGIGEHFIKLRVNNNPEICLININ